MDPVRELLRTLPGVVYRCAYDVEWTMQLISDEIVVVTGFPAEGFVGNRDRSFASVIHPDDRDRLEGEIAVQLAEQAANRAVAEERTNVARERHDAVGHTLRVVALHAGVATTQLPAGSEAAAATLGIIREVVKETTNDIDRLLRTLGAPSGGPVASGLNDVSSLVDRVRAAGVPVALVIEGEPRRLPPEADHTAFRVVQEGLTNVMEHAQDAAVTIRVGHGNGSATLEVIDHGPTEPVPADPPSAERRGGRGLAGLSDRVHELGGELTAGPRAEGGFAVTTVLPYGEPDLPDAAPGSHPRLNAWPYS